jgi:hypothetical protein
MPPPAAPAKASPPAKEVLLLLVTATALLAPARAVAKVRRAAAPATACTTCSTCCVLSTFLRADWQVAHLLVCWEYLWKERRKRRGGSSRCEGVQVWYRKAAF